MIAIAVVLALILGVFGVGYVLATGGEDAEVPAASTPPGLADHEPIHRAERGSIGRPRGRLTTPEPEAAVLEDGRHFVYARSVSEGATGPELTFDLAYFYMGEEAAQVAADRGDESPPTNGYYIVNDNPMLRTMPIAPSAMVRYVPERSVLRAEAGEPRRVERGRERHGETDYPNMRYVGWWITVQDGEIVRIVMQWVP